MSSATIDEVVKKRITVCDICGGEVEEPREGADDEIGSIVAPDSTVQEQATTEHKRMRLRWPSSSLRRALELQGVELQSRRVRDYDFHGRCIIRLVEAAIELRTKKPEVDEGFEPLPF